MRRERACDGGRAGLSRRDFLALAAAGAAGTGVSGCATNPVTGRKQLMLISESGEIGVDRENAPHQLSADYGPVQNAELNAYLSGVGMQMAALTHRPHMPYTFRAVNATYVNAYTFPGGTVAATRGILLDMESEAELAALFGHELGHVNARHTAQRMTQGILAQLAVAGIAAYVQSENQKYTDLAAGLGGVGAGLLLAHYSRANEREADALGMEYMVRAGYTPRGMVALMDHLRRMGHDNPSAIEKMFATHPMSDERYETAGLRVVEQYKDAASLPDQRERYMDRTAPVRAQRKAIEEMQKGDKLMMAKKPDAAQGHYAAALGAAPDDYAGLLSMAKCLLAQSKSREAAPFIEKARHVYPGEPQAEHVRGMAALSARDFDTALASFDAYERRLPGNANTVFYRGFALEQMGRRQEAAQAYSRYRMAAPQGEFAGFTTQRLVNWGYLQPAPAGTPK